MHMSQCMTCCVSIVNLSINPVPRLLLTYQAHRIRTVALLLILILHLGLKTCTHMMVVMCVCAGQVSPLPRLVVLWGKTKQFWDTFRIPLELTVSLNQNNSSLQTMMMMVILNGKEWVMIVDDMISLRLPVDEQVEESVCQPDAGSPVNFQHLMHH